MTSDPPSIDMRKVWQNQSTEPAAMALGEIRKKAQKFQKRIYWRNLREYAAAVIVVAGFGFHFWRLEGTLLRTGSALVIAGTLYVMYQLYRRGSAKPMPAEAAVRPCLDYHRRELERQRDLLRDVWKWYLLPLVPGMVVFLLGRAVENPPGHWAPLSVTVVLCVVVFVGLGKLNQWAAGKLQRQIDALNVLGKES